jgi:ABC-type metal ion transport system substrate-binding protein
MTKRSPVKQWQKGDLVLLENEPKVHARLLVIVEVNGSTAKVAPLDLATAADATSNRREEIFSPLEALVDPAMFLKTDEFLETLRSHLREMEARKK